MKKIKVNHEKLLKRVCQLILILLTTWIAISFIDYNFARTMYGGMILSKYNILVVLHNITDNLLKGFIW